MNQEIKQKLEQAAESVVMKLYYRKPSEGSSELDEFNEFKSVAISLAQTILEKPSEWGLVPKAQHDHYMAKYTSLVEWYDKLMGTPCEQVRHQQEIESMQSQPTKYREALERIMEESWSFERPHKIAKEALKQEKQ